MHLGRLAPVIAVLMIVAACSGAGSSLPSSSPASSIPTASVSTGATPVALILVDTPRLDPAAMPAKVGPPLPALSAPFRQHHGEVGKTHGEAQPKRDLQVELERFVRVQDQQNSGDYAANLNHEHDGIPHHLARVKLEHGINSGSANDG